MTYRQCTRMLLVAIVGVAALGVGQANAGGRFAAIVPFYGYGGSAAYMAPGYGYGYGYSYGSSYRVNPYMAPLPFYGILPPPYTTINMYGNGYLGNQGYGAYGATTNQLNYVPRMRSSEYPAVPYTTKPPAGVTDVASDVKRFRFEVTVPTADAIVLLDGAATTQTGLHRDYVTPPLMADKRYTYNIEVQWLDGARTRRSEKMAFDFLLGEPTAHLQFPLKMAK